MFKDIKNQFPIFKNKTNGKDLIYLDSANSSQKPQSVIDAVSNFYSNEFANVGRGIYSLAVNASEKYELTRTNLKSFVGASDDYEIVFTKNATESLNLVATCFAEKFIKDGDEIRVWSRCSNRISVMRWTVCVQAAHPGLGTVIRIY